MRYLGEQDLTQVMGIGYLGEVRQGPDGNLYQWTQGVDGLGNPVGFWRKALKRLGRRVIRRALPIFRQVAPLIPAVGPAAAALRVAAPLLRRAAPVLQQVAPFVPAVAPAAAAVTAAAPLATEAAATVAPPPAAPAPEAGTAGWGLGALYQAPDGALYQVHGLSQDPELQGLGALYQAPDGSLYQVQGVGQDDDLRGLDEADELQGFGEDDELRGFAEADELQGFGEDDELRGFAEADELQGFGEDDELRGFAEADELQGLEQGYVREDGVNGLEAYVSDHSEGTRWFVPPGQPPELWKPLW
jgi:hypothetical protein